EVWSLQKPHAHPGFCQRFTGSVASWYTPVSSLPAWTARERNKSKGKGPVPGVAFPASTGAWTPCRRDPPQFPSLYTERSDTAMATADSKIVGKEELVHLIAAKAK